MAAQHGWPFLGEIPIDPSVRVGGDVGTPVVISHPDSAVARASSKVQPSVSAANRTDGSRDLAELIRTRQTSGGTL